MDFYRKEQLADKESHHDTPEEFDAKSHGNQHENPPHQLLESIQHDHDRFPLAFGFSNQIEVPKLFLTMRHSLTHDGQQKGANHGKDKLPGMIQLPIDEQKDDAIRRTPRKQRRLESTHRHSHGHSLAKLHPVVAVAVAVAVAVLVVPIHVHVHVPVPVPVRNRDRDRA